MVFLLWISLMRHLFEIMILNNKLFSKYYPVNEHPKNVEPSHNSKQNKYSGFVLYRIPFKTKTKAPRNPNIRKVFFINNKNINIRVVNISYKLPMLHNYIYLF